MTTQAPVAATLTVMVPMFGLARGPRLSSYHREWLEGYYDTRSCPAARADPAARA